jgi:hypothetical protein
VEGWAYFTVYYEREGKKFGYQNFTPGTILRPEKDARAVRTLYRLRSGFVIRFFTRS